MKTKAIETIFYNDIIQKNIIKDLKTRLYEYQFGKWSDCPENIREDNIRNIKAQLWEWGVSKTDLEKI